MIENLPNYDLAVLSLTRIVSLIGCVLLKKYRDGDSQNAHKAFDDVPLATSIIYIQS